VNFSTALPNANCSVAVSSSSLGLDGRNFSIGTIDTGYATSNIRVASWNQVSGAPTDPVTVGVLVVG
jgi:hypothetical protein